MLATIGAVTCERSALPIAAFQILEIENRP